MSAAVYSYHETNGARQPVEDAMTAVDNHQVARAAATGISVRERALAAFKARIADEISTAKAEEQQFLEKYGPGLRARAAEFLAEDEENLPLVELTSDPVWTHRDSENPKLVLWITDHEGCAVALTLDPDRPDGSDLYVTVACSQCKRYRRARHIGHLDDLGGAMMDSVGRCTDCTGVRSEERKSSVQWPSRYDEETHDPQITLAENSRIIANNLAVIATALEDINANGLPR